MHRIVSMGGLLVILLAVSWLGWLGPANELLRDARFALDERQPSGGIVFVEIDAASLEAVGVWPWPRRLHAELLNRLLDLGAAEVAFDIDFSVASNPEDDRLLEQALADAGGYALLAAFRQLPRPAEAPEFTEPLPRFAAHAAAVGVNVATDGSGIVRRVLAAMDMRGEVVPSLPVALAATRPPSAEFLIDYALDPAGIDRIGAGDVLAGRVAAERIEDRQVVIGASALELRDVMMTPVHGALPGALIQILAAESVRQGRALAPPDRLHSVLLVLGAGLLAMLLRKRLPLPSGILAVAAAMLALEGAAFLLQQQAGLLVNTVGAQLMLAGAVVLSLGIEAFEKRRLHQEAARQRQAALERLAHAATYDELTGAFSRTGLAGRIAEAMNRGEALAVIAVGLDRFDRINGALGYDIGDEVLRQVVARLRQIGEAEVGRIATTGFALLLAGDKPPEPYCEAARRALRRVFVAAGHEVIVGAHLGLASWRPGDGALAAVALLSRAELARSVAAIAPNAPFVRHEPAMEARFNAARKLELGLRDALAHRQLDVYFQGQFDLRNGRLLGAEALARWTPAGGAPVPPATFIALAEETGLALPLGVHVFERACRVAAQWPEQLRVSINVSPSQFEFDDVPALIERALRASGLAPSRLDIEITEGLLLDASATRIDTLAAVRRMGVGIALDDFGTGYSSLSYLGTLPINKLKIDQSFVRRLAAEQRVDSIVEAVLTMCRDLGMTAVAEGVETELQAGWLRERGCDMGQGYLFHRPAPAADFLRLARASADGTGRAAIAS